MRQNKEDVARNLFFGFIVLCAIAAIFALGLVVQGGGQTGGLSGGGATYKTGGFMGGGENDDDDD